MSEVRLSLYKRMRIKIETDDNEYIKQMVELFSRHVEGYHWFPQYRSGGWNGKAYMIDKLTRTFPYGILIEFIKVHKKFYENKKLSVDDEVKKLFKGVKIEPKYDLTLYPRPYQKEAIESCLERTKGIIRSSTASGKSCVIAYIIKSIFESNKKVKKQLIVVPSISLIEQFYDDLIEYGIKYDIGRVHSKSKEWDKELVISTWQSLMKNHKRLPEFQSIICDECHGVKSYEFMKIMKQCGHMDYKLGFTGTLHSAELDNWNTMSYLGPVLKDYPSGLLADEGWISKCNIVILHLNYNNREKYKDLTYNDVKDYVFNNKFRMELIRDILNDLDDNVLLLVGKVEKEGDILKPYLEEVTKREIVFLSGRDSADKREEWRKRMMKRKNIGLIATYGIFQAGINIPNLKYIILVSPFKSKIRILQSVGRALRKYSNKEEGAFIYDIHDNVPYFDKHGKVRYRYYDMEKFNIEEFELNEGELYKDKRVYVE